MLNDKLAAGRQIARNLMPSEDTVDNSIINTSRLLISIVEARLKTGAAAETMHLAVGRAISGLTSLKDAREHIVACHQELAAVRDAHHLSPMALGCTTDKFSNPMSTNEAQAA